MEDILQGAPADPQLQAHVHDGQAPVHRRLDEVPRPAGHAPRVHVPQEGAPARLLVVTSRPDFLQHGAQRGTRQAVLPIGVLVRRQPLRRGVQGLRHHLAQEIFIAQMQQATLRKTRRPQRLVHAQRGAMETLRIDQQVHHFGFAARVDIEVRRTGLEGERACAQFAHAHAHGGTVAGQEERDEVVRHGDQPHDGAALRLAAEGQARDREALEHAVIAAGSRLVIAPLDAIEQRRLLAGLADFRAGQAGKAFCGSPGEG